jgi:hypothetical protein
MSACPESLDRILLRQFFPLRASNGFIQNKALLGFVSQKAS